MPIAVDVEEGGRIRIRRALLVGRENNVDESENDRDLFPSHLSSPG
jgi:hypothetical protein